jgi:hypothetical protein
LGEPFDAQGRAAPVHKNTGKDASATNTGRSVLRPYMIVPIAGSCSAD